LTRKEAAIENFQNSESDVKYKIISRNNPKFREKGLQKLLSCDFFF
jgi:hypothetical protein